MAEPTPTAEVGPADGAQPTPTRAPRGTTRLSRLSAVLAWFVGVWFLAFGLLWVPLLVVGALMIWLGTGAWKGRRRRTTTLAVVSTVAALYYPLAAWWSWSRQHDGIGGYPALRIVMLSIQSALLLTIAVTAVLSLRRRADETPATAGSSPEE